MSLIKRGYNIAKEDGLRTFLSELSKYICWVSRKKYWEFSSSATISIRSCQAEFGISGRAPYSLRIFERNEREMLGDVLDEILPTDTFWDIGANIGYYSCFVGQQAEVIAFEPSPIAAEQCRQNLVRNNIEVPVYEYALAASCGTITLPPGIVAKTEGEEVEVESKRGDKIVENLAPPTVVKMDVEGAELDVIDGMQKTLSSDKCRLLYCEVHIGGRPDRKSIADYGETLDSFNRRLEELGFDVEMLKNRKTEVHIKGKKNPS